MPRFVISYIGGNHPDTPEQQQEHMTRYREWLTGLGEAAVSPMNPFKNTHSVKSDGSVSASGTTNMSGFTMIEADNIESAVSTAQACPFLDIGGVLEVSELVDMGN